MSGSAIRDLESSCQFNESAFMHPIPSTSKNSIFKNGNSLNNHTKSFSKMTEKASTGINGINRDHYGGYERFKLTQLLGNEYFDDFQMQSERTLPSNNNEPVIEVLTIDPHSMVIEINQKFFQFMKKYMSYDVTLVTVVGQRGSGKSLFCDRVLNLSQIKGNHFCKKKEQGIYMWETPFIKNNLCVFLMEIGGCGIKEAAFRALNSIALLISSQYVLIHPHHDREERSLESFKQYILKSLKAYDLPQEYQCYLPPIIHNLYRFQNNQSAAKSSTPPPFLDLHPHHLPEARTSSYTGQDNDLQQYPFIMSEVMNPAYVESVSNITKSIYRLGYQKKILVDNNHELILNGNIINKVITHCVQFLNSRKKIKVEKMYEQILRELYLSAYNYCVMIYHDELGENFDDEEPKPVEQILRIFQQSKQKTLQEFSNFNLSRSLFEEYEKKLQNHIDSKEELILQVNRKKIEEKLREHVSDKNNCDLNRELKIISTFRTELNDGRDGIIKQLLCRMYKNAGGNSPDIKLLQQIEQLNAKVANKEQELKEVKRKAAQRRKQAQTKIDKNKGEQRQYKKQLERLNEQIRKVEENVNHQKKKMKNIKEGKRSEQDIINEREKLESKKIDQKKLLKEFQAQNIDTVVAQMTNANKQKIVKVIEEQRKIEQKLAALKTSKVNSQKPNQQKMHQSKTQKDKPSNPQGSNLKNSKPTAPK